MVQRTMHALVLHRNCMVANAMAWNDEMTWFDRLCSWTFRHTANTPPPRNFHIAVLSFDRPHYLKPVLKSLRAQISPQDNVTLFQDGAFNRFSGRMKADPARIKECVRLFRAIIPWGKIVESDHNLGIAFNYERAETHVFEGLGSERALFLEDDMVLSPNYLDVTGQLLAMADQDARIGYVAAYGDFWASQSEQRAGARQLMPMHENWGAALTRTSCLAERPFRKAYLDLVRDVDYSRRDHERIIEFYAQRGWKTNTTSQDAARWIACLERGAVRITTKACHAHYIGAKGEHFTPALYRARRYAKSIMFKGDLQQLAPPSTGDIAAWLAAEKQRFLGKATLNSPARASV